MVQGESSSLLEGVVWVDEGEGGRDGARTGEREYMGGNKMRG